jgi:hypothetical protein
MGGGGGDFTQNYLVILRANTGHVIAHGTVEATGPSAATVNFSRANFAGNANDVHMIDVMPVVGRLACGD